jgi:hypothetical protein
MKTKVWQNKQLKPNLKEDEDYMIVDEDINNLISKKYGIKQDHEI